LLTQCSLVSRYRRFGGKCCLSLQEMYAAYSSKTPDSAHKNIRFLSSFYHDVNDERETPKNVYHVHTLTLRSSLHNQVAFILVRGTIDKLRSMLLSSAKYLLYQSQSRLSRMFHCEPMGSIPGLNLGSERLRQDSISN
jgi:hypothetical protein